MDIFFPKLYLIVESCFAIFLGGLGIFLIYFALRLNKDDEKCQSWPISQGVIINTEIITECDPKGKISYIPFVQYIFQANHQMVQGCKLCVGCPPISHVGEKRSKSLKIIHLAVKCGFFSILITLRKLCLSVVFTIADTVCSWAAFSFY